ncbi:uncharacterized protein RCC_12269 [Ramularia collo-cygni]|uniref:Uncharacterized protein n=1 Tax=Ramularia collo-cygni TaxID=112498 RepID=A0A2D3UM81_9PEZI|nr:uncharacterized protein RCC_12269 [Ramularia collo-cygni]CZT14951.1 uncharacterized protein RCC_12269 [Ramularia collo-cygni]
MIALTALLAQHFPHADITALQSASENGDEETHDALVRGFFSTWKTSLLGSDLQSLRDLSQHQELSKFVTTIHIQDDWEVNDPGPMVAGPDAGPPAGAIHIWPRDEERNVKSGDIGIAELRDMLINRKFRPEIIKIRDFHGGNIACDPGPCATLVKDLLDGAGMAVKSFEFKRDTNSYGALEILFTFYPEDQGRDVGLARLQSAQFILTRNVKSYWQERILRAANPIDLTIAHAKPSPDADAPFVAGMSAPKLASLNLVRQGVSSKAVVRLIANSQTCLKSITFHMVTLTDSTSWCSLLSQIAQDCGSLSSFNLSLLRTASRETPSVKFRISKESVVEQDRNSLKITEKGPKHQRRVSAVRYNGPNVANVLQVVAESVVNWGYVPGTWDLIHE